MIAADAADRFNQSIDDGAMLVSCGAGLRPSLPVLPPGSLLVNDGGFLRLFNERPIINPLRQWADRMAQALPAAPRPALIDALVFGDRHYPILPANTHLIIEAPYICGFAFFARLSGLSLATHAPAQLIAPLWRERYEIAVALADAAGFEGEAAAVFAETEISKAGGPPHLRRIACEAVPMGDASLKLLSDDLGQTLGVLPTGATQRIAVHQRLERALASPRDSAGGAMQFRHVVWRALLAPAIIATRLACRRLGKPALEIPDVTRFPTLIPELLEQLRQLRPHLPGTFGGVAPSLATALTRTTALAQTRLSDAYWMEWLSGYWPDLARVVLALVRAENPASLRAPISRILAIADGRNLGHDHL